MTTKSMTIRIAGAALAAGLAFGPAPAAAQSPAHGETPRERTRLDAPSGALEPDPAFTYMLERYVAVYTLGPGDEIAVRVDREPDYSIDRTTVSPFGSVQHPLLGDVRVAGLTAGRAAALIESELREFIIEPRVSVTLLTAHSAKVGVIGDVTQPGILTLAQPMTVLDAISASGGVTHFGSKTNVTVLRQLGGGEMRTYTVNLKRILEGKAGKLENLALQPGDTVVVHGNRKKALATITSVTGFASFLTFLRR